MRLISYEGGFGRIEGSNVVPMGSDVVAFLRDGRAAEGTPVPLDSVRQLPPVPTPGKIICVGLNYRQHAIETGSPIPAEPPLFAKYANSLIADGELIRVPAATKRPDWEAELGVGSARTPARWLQDGEEVTIELERLGSITNRVVRVGAETHAAPAEMTA